MEPEKSSKLISMKEVEEHNSMGGQKSIWMVIHDKVYDVTNFLDEVKSYSNLQLKSLILRPCYVFSMAS